MTKKKRSAKNAFISSLVTLCLCVTMLVGTTFAWYTDSVTSGRNTIVAGSLDMVVEYYDNTNGDTTFDENNWHPVTNAVALFDDAAMFEPGAAQVAYIRISNGGDLAFKYGVSVVVDNEDEGTNQAGQPFKLSNYLVFGKVARTAPYPKTTAGRDAAITDAGTTGKLVNAASVVAADTVLRADDNAVIFALVIYMPTTVGSEANPDPNHKPSITFGINAIATQYVVENDGFGTDYDSNAGYPAAPVIATVANGEATFTSSEAPVDNKTTTVAVDGLDNVNNGDTLTLNVETTDLAASAGNSDFEVASGNTAIAGIDLTLQNTAGQKVTFDNGEATVTTYITPGLDANNITVKYNGTGADPTNVTYDPATGRLTFKTTHFSEFYVEYSGMWYYVPSTGKAYATENDLDDAIFEIAEAAVGDSINKLNVDQIIAGYASYALDYHFDAHHAIYSYLMSCQYYLNTGLNDWLSYDDGDDVYNYVVSGTTGNDIKTMYQSYSAAYSAARVDYIIYPVLTDGFYVTGPKMAVEPFASGW